MVSPIPRLLFLWPSFLSSLRCWTSEEKISSFLNFSLAIFSLVSDQWAQGATDNVSFKSSIQRWLFNTHSAQRFFFFPSADTIDHFLHPWQLCSFLLEFFLSLGASMSLYQMPPLCLGFPDTWHKFFSLMLFNILCHPQLRHVRTQEMFIRFHFPVGYPHLPSLANDVLVCEARNHSPFQCHFLTLILFNYKTHKGASSIAQW